VITAQLTFEAPQVRLFAKYASTAKWEEAQMVPRNGTSYEFLFAGLPEPVEYYVEASGVKSQTYKLDVIIRNDQGTIFINHLVSTTVVFDNNWHHIAWVDNFGSVKLYVDGNLDAANFNYTPSGTMTVNTAAIGTLVRTTVAGTGNTFNGLIDDVSVWERALSQAEVNQMRTNGIPTPIVAVPPVLTSVPANTTNNTANVTTFVKDAFGRTTQVTDPSSHSTTYAYDRDSNVTSKTDRDGRVIDYTYDNLNRESGEIWAKRSCTLHAAGGGLSRGCHTFD
jgi:YD repeat-containing protein